MLATTVTILLKCPFGKFLTAFLISIPFRKAWPVSSTNQIFLKRLRQLGTVEGVSTLVLFGIAMPLKYLADMPLAVRIVGSLHGLLFVSLAMMLLLAITRVPIPGRLAFFGIIAAVIPFGPFVYDRWLAEIFEESIAECVSGETDL